MSSRVRPCGHHLLDGVDPAHRLHRVEALAAAVLALAAHAAAARQQPRLHVLAKGGLGEAHALGAEDLEDRAGRQAAGELALDARQLSQGRDNPLNVGLRISATDWMLLSGVTFSSRGLGRSGRSPTRREVSGRRVGARASRCGPARAARCTAPDDPVGPGQLDQVAPRGQPHRPAALHVPGPLAVDPSSAQGLARITRRACGRFPRASALPCPGGPLDVARAGSPATGGPADVGHRWRPTRGCVDAAALAAVDAALAPGPSARARLGAPGRDPARSRETRRASARSGPEQRAPWPRRSPATASAGPRAARRERPGTGSTSVGAGSTGARRQPLRRLRERLRTGRGRLMRDRPRRRRGGQRDGDGAHVRSSALATPASSENIRRRNAPTSVSSSERAPPQHHLGQRALQLVRRGPAACPVPLQRPHHRRVERPRTRRG